MRYSVSVVLAILAACELQPKPKEAPKVQEAPTAVTPTAAPPTAPQPEEPPRAQPAPTAEVQAPITEPCAQVGMRYFEIALADADPTQKSMLERERLKTVRGIAEACTAQSWNDEVRSCVLAAKGIQDLKVCQLKLAAQQQANPTPAPTPVRAPQGGRVPDPSAPQPVDPNAGKQPAKLEAVTPPVVPVDRGAPKGARPPGRPAPVRPAAPQQP